MTNGNETITKEWFTKFWGLPVGSHSYERNVPLKQTDQRLCLNLLAGERRCRKCLGRHTCLTYELGFDHTHGWMMDGKLVAITTQPYGLSTEKMERLIHICKALGINMEIDTRSWHNFGSCWLIVFTSPDYDERRRESRFYESKQEEE